MSVLHAVMHADTSDGDLHAQQQSSDGVQAPATYTDAADHMVWDSSSSSEHLDRLFVQAKNRPSSALGEDQIKHLCWSGNNGVALPVTLQPAGRKAAGGDRLASRFDASGAGSDSTIGDGSVASAAAIVGGYAEAKSWRRRQQVAPRTAELAEALKKPGHAGDAATSGAEADIEIDALDSESGLSAPDNSLRSGRAGPGQGEMLGTRMDSLGKQECLHVLAKRKKKCQQMLLVAGLKEQLKTSPAGGMGAALHTVWDSGHSGEDQETVEARVRANQRGRGGIIAL